MKYIFVYLLSINLITFLLFAIDKQKAKKHKYRISEKTLLLFSFFGGSLGALLAMLICHHKTKHIKFLLLVPVFLILHVLLLGFILSHI